MTCACAWTSLLCDCCRMKWLARARSAAHTLAKGTQDLGEQQGILPGLDSSVPWALPAADYLVGRWRGSVTWAPRGFVGLPAGLAEDA